MKAGEWWAVVGLVLLVAYYARHDSSTQAHSPADGQSNTTSPSEPMPDANTDAPPSRQLTFHGYDCTDDCSGHRAGYEWAEEHNITDPDDCGGNSQSFIEGCKAYAGEEGDDTDGDEHD